MFEIYWAIKTFHRFHTLSLNDHRKFPSSSPDSLQIVLISSSAMKTSKFSFKCGFAWHFLSSLIFHRFSCFSTYTSGYCAHSSIEINTNFFFRENVFRPPKNHWLRTEKILSTSSAKFVVGTVSRCCKLKECADRVRSREHNKDEVRDKICNLNFLPSTKNTTEYSFEFFPFIDIRCFVS